ncbi:capsule-associated protein CAP1, partial [Ceratobasidium sp. 394]
MPPSIGDTLYRFRVLLFIIFLFFLTLILKSQPQLQPTLEIPQTVHKWTATVKALLTNSAPKPIEHPIPRLMLAAHRKHKGMLARQSATLSEAVKEYERRYGRQPPRGFDEWFAFVKENDVKIVDEYDSMVRDLEPFWGLEGKEMRRRAEQVGELASIDLVRIRNGNVTLVNVERGNNGSEVSARAQGFAQMIQKFQHKLPDMVFAINARAEARVLVPWAHIAYPNSTNQDSSVGLAAMLGAAGGATNDKDAHLIADWHGQSSVWEAFRQTCPPASEARRLFRSLQGHGSAQSAFSRATGQAVVTTTETSKSNIVDEVDPYQGADSDFSFAEDTQAGFDYCRHPEAH